MKKLFLVSLVLLMCVSLVFVGCTNNQAATSGENVETLEIDFATVYDAQAPTALSMTKFKELVDEESGGAIKVNVFTNGSLGNEKDLNNSLAVGELHMALGGTLAIDQFAPEYGFFLAPYLINSWEHLEAILDGELGERMFEAMDASNVHMLATHRRGVRNTTSEKPFTTPEELKGIKLRLPEIPSWVTLYSGIGAMPSPVSLGELYTSLQTGVVDASEGQYEQMATFKLYEVQDYVINTNHMYGVSFISINKDFFEGLSEEQQEIITSCAVEAMKYADDLAEQKSQEYLKELTDNGMQVIEPDRAAFVEAAKPVLKDMFIKYWDKTSYDEVMSYVK